MRVKVSWDEGATFEGPCDLRECYPDDVVGYAEAYIALKRPPYRHWEGGGAMALCLLVNVHNE